MNDYGMAQRVNIAPTSSKQGEEISMIVVVGKRNKSVPRVLIVVEEVRNTYLMSALLLLLYAAFVHAGGLWCTVYFVLHFCGTLCLDMLLWMGDLVDAWPESLVL